MRKLIIPLTIILLIALSIVMGHQSPQVVEANENLIRNPGFEGQYSAWQPQYGTAQMAPEWTPWWVEDANHDPVYAQPEYKPAERQFFPNRVWEGDKAQQWFTFHKSHNGGMYQQIFGVTPGQTYRFSILVQVWSSTGDNPNISETTGDPRFAIGIDPTGAAQPGWVAGSPSTVQWSPNAPMDAILDRWHSMSVEAVAQNSTITVYMRGNPQYAVKHNDFYVDAANLVAVGNPVPPPQPTNTPVPPGGDPCAIPPSGPWPCGDDSGPWTPGPPGGGGGGGNPPPDGDPCAPPPSGPWPCGDDSGPWTPGPPGGGGGGGGNPSPTNTPVPPPPANAGLFQFGGQTHTLENPNLMADVGMEWVKFQHKWGISDPPSAIASRISDAHARGFKVLMSIPGADHNNIDFGAYVNFLGGVAALPDPPDAIEVWNEQNIDREWPNGQINATQYVNEMLRPAYQAIKAANPNVQVISGAPAPTGFFGGGCTASGCDDKPYMEEMFAAGAANYTDCVGIHYNEGILPPSQTTGDPRGNGEHYTRYFWGMVDTYWNAFQGTRPLCFTEIGYLSGDDFGGLPPGFSWAATTSVDEHAQWLAEATQLSKDSPRIQMMIIFNIDFTHYDINGDPQAGFAMIRPGGGCPSCPLVRAVMQP